VHARVFAPRADAADAQRVTEAAADIPGATAVASSCDPSDPGAACRREPTPLVAFVDAPPSGHQMPTVQIGAENRLWRSELESSRMPHIDVAILDVL
jgi:hypothetical protein